jgi:hypothetical protein
VRTFFPELRNRIRIMMFGVSPAPEISPDIRSPRERVASGRPGRPISTALSRTLEELTANPQITAAELASVLSVSPSYARTLLRRARARRTDGAAPARPRVIHSIARPEPSAANVQDTVHEVSPRTPETEPALLAPAPLRGSLNLSRRSEVLRLSEAGQSAAVIAENLGVPGGEVDFILKIDRFLASATQAG